jgi:lysophospholipase L1-like esterase
MQRKICVTHNHQRARARLALLGLCAGLCGCGGGGSGTSGPPVQAILTPNQPLLQALNAQGPVRIMPLGDSNTWGQFVPGSYRTQLYQDLTTEGIRTQFVGSLSNGPDTLPSKSNEGHSGWTISNLAGSADAWLRASQPQIVLLMIGTNDVWQQRDMADAPKRLGDLIDQIARDLPQSYIVVASVPPMSSLDNNSGIVAYNSAIAPLVAARAAGGEHVSFADIYAAVPPADLMDEAHYNAAGYAKTADVWNDALKSLLSKP